MPLKDIEGGAVGVGRKEEIPGRAERCVGPVELCVVCGLMRCGRRVFGFVNGRVGA